MITILKSHIDSFLNQNWFQVSMNHSLLLNFKFASKTGHQFSFNSLIDFNEHSNKSTNNSGWTRAFMQHPLPIRRRTNRFVCEDKWLLSTPQHTYQSHFQKLLQKSLITNIGCKPCSFFLSSAPHFKLYAFEFSWEVLIPYLATKWP